MGLAAANGSSGADARPLSALFGGGNENADVDVGNGTDCRPPRPDEANGSSVAFAFVMNVAKPKASRLSADLLVVVAVAAAGVAEIVDVSLGSSSNGSAMLNGSS